MQAGSSMDVSSCSPCVAGPAEFLVQKPDANLVCSVCLSLFNTPLRTKCGHVFCGGCIRGWIGEEGRGCPACRAPVVEEELAPDRLASALIDNLPSYCQLHASGCTWLGTHGEVHSHLATSCPCVLLTCPGCELEVPRRALAEHALTCAGGAHRECPFGCGERFVGAERLSQHKADCLMEPRKLLAALGHMQRENERLTHENLALRSSEPVRGPPAVASAPPAPLCLFGTHRGGLARLVHSQTEGPPTTPHTKKRRAHRGPGMCVE